MNTIPLELLFFPLVVAIFLVKPQITMTIVASNKPFVNLLISGHWVCKNILLFLTKGFLFTHA